ncbi:hypothetical protein VTK56DRAFT_3469 [Thermocarpiscus australiensis]
MLGNIQILTAGKGREGLVPAVPLTSSIWTLGWVILKSTGEGLPLTRVLDTVRRSPAGRDLTRGGLLRLLLFAAYSILRRLQNTLCKFTRAGGQSYSHWRSAIRPEVAVALQADDKAQIHHLDCRGYMTSSYKLYYGAAFVQIMKLAGQGENVCSKGQCARFVGSTGEETEVQDFSPQLGRTFPLALPVVCLG